MKQDFMKPPPWEGEEKAFERIVEYIQELTGFEGEITNEDLLVEDIGLDSLDFLELFFKIQSYIRRELSNKQLNRLLTAEVLSEETSDPDHQGISLYSRLRVRHLVGLIKRQLSNPMSVEGFDYEIWREKFFPRVQSKNPANQSWVYWASRFSKNEADFKGFTKKLESINVETLEYLWLEDELGLQVLEDNLRAYEGQIDDLLTLEEILNNYLDNKNLLEDLKIQLIKSCLLKSLDVGISSDSDEWTFIVESYVNKQLSSEKFYDWVDLDLLGVKLNIEEDLRLREILSKYMINFIRSKIDQILISPEEQTDLLQDFIQEEYDATESGLFSAGNFQQSQTRMIDWYVKNNKLSLIKEFRESHQEDLLSEINLVPELEPFSANQQHFMNSYKKSFIKSSPVKFIEMSDTENILMESFHDEMHAMKFKWSSKINYLARFPRCGSNEDRLLVLFLTDLDWTKILESQISRFRNDLSSIYHHTSQLNSIAGYSIFENLYLQVVLEWSELMKSVQNNSERLDLKNIEETWLGIDINIGDTAYPALDIFLRFGVSAFKSWRHNHLMNFFTNPSDESLSELVESAEIRSLEG